MTKAEILPRMRVLQVLGSLDRGGAESMLVSLYKSIDRDRIQFDFLVPDRPESYAFEAAIEGLGGRVFKCPRFSPLSVLAYCRYLSELLDEHQEWRVVHFHYLSSSIVSFPIARMSKRKIVAHSHTAGMVKSVKSFARLLTQMPARFLADERVACSKDAGVWMFGKNENVRILPNGVHLERFRYGPDQRARIREELKLREDALVIGHVGRFSAVKNHSFIMDIFSELVAMDDRAVLVLVGDGALRAAIQEKAKSLDVFDRVYFVGVRPDVDDILSAMDAMLLPSLHEGLPVTLIEAQANGLPCLVSDTVSSDARITSLVEFMSLGRGAKAWAARLLDVAREAERAGYQDQLAEAGYDVSDNARWLGDFYEVMHRS